MSTPNVSDITERIRQQLAAAEDEGQGEQRQTPEEAAAEHFEERVSGMLAELLDTGDLDSIPPLVPVIDGLIFRDTLARIFGPSGTFKSFITLDIAGCVATGRAWHDINTRPGTVVYLVAEGMRGIRKRVRAWEQHHGTKMTGVKFLPRPVQALDPEWEVLIEVCRRLAPALIVVDTQARVTVGVEENSNTEMGRIVHRMEELRAASGACLLLVHHTGHDEGRSRGASAVKGALQTELGITRKDDPAAGPIITLKTGKQKDDEELPDMEFGVHSVAIDGEANEDGSPVTSVVIIRVDAPRPTQPTEATRIREIAARLDAAGVPSAYGRERLRAACDQLGITAENKILSAVAKHRKNRANTANDLSADTLENTPGTGQGK